MGTEENKRITTGGIFLIILAGLLLIFMAYYAVMLMRAPSKKLAEINEKYLPKQVEGKPFDERMLSDSAYVNMLKKKAFLQSRVSMAESDSIYLTLNFENQTASLELCGVIVHSVKMNSYSVSRILTVGDDYVISSMLSSPMNIVKDYSTIRKEPVMIKMAPKDTSEYKPDIVPDTIDHEPVRYIFDMDNGLQIFFTQTPDTSVNQKAFYQFDFQNRLKTTKGYLNDVMHFKVPEYRPFIKIEIPKSDAKILYRAIPRYGQIAVYF